jgi:hemerythrin-like domain-containing protein
MECTREFRADYAHIDTMLSVLEACLTRLTRRQYVDPQMLRGVLRFFRDFVQGCHQLKVEALVFPLLARKRTAVESEAIGLLRSQYQSGGALLDEIAPLITQLPDGRVDMARLMSSARRYINESRRHFLTERSLLEDLLPEGVAPDEDEALTSEFARLERNSIGPTAREWYTQMILDYRDIVSTWSHSPG